MYLIDKSFYEMYENVLAFTNQKCLPQLKLLRKTIISFLYWRHFKPQEIAH